MDKNFYSRLQEILPAERIKEEEPMRLHTTFRVGGPARFFVMPETAEELQGIIACCRVGVLLGETLPLINGIVQLRVSVGHFPAVHKEFKPLHIVRILRFLLGQRRDFNGMIHYKCRLYQMFLYKFFK